jgi:hypothetical protein
MPTLRTSRSRLRQKEAIEFRLLFTVTFTVFLMAAAVSRLLPADWRPLPPQAGADRSIIGEAKAAANMIVPYAFMG